MSPSEAAPATLPGGGVLIEQFHLLAARDREYRVSLVGELAGKALDGEYTEWVVGTTCPCDRLAVIGVRQPGDHRRVHEPAAVYEKLITDDVAAGRGDHRPDLRDL